MRRTTGQNNHNHKQSDLQALRHSRDRNAISHKQFIVQHLVGNKMFFTDTVFIVFFIMRLYLIYYTCIYIQDIHILVTAKFIMHDHVIMLRHDYKA